MISVPPPVPHAPAAPPPIPAAVPAPPAPAEGAPTKPPRTYSVDRVWSPKLARRFTAVSNYFLANLHRIAPEGGKGLTPTEAMVIVQTLSFKWDERPPKPALRTIATRLGLAVRTVRDTMKRLEELGLVEREPNFEGGCNRYHFDGLFKRLEEMMAKDAEKTNDAEASDDDKEAA
jgi:DNA-binding MarR family transcriptional regulator